MSYRATLVALFAIMARIPSALADSPEFANFIAKAPCGDQVRLGISRMLVNQTWRPVMVAPSGKPLVSGIVFRNTRTEKLNQLHSDATSTTLVETRLTGEFISANVWDRRFGCRLRSTDYKSRPRAALAQVRPEVAAHGFGDEDLLSLIRGQPWGIIYVWSPAMPLSIEAIKEIKEAIRPLGGHLTILMDGRIDLRQAEELVRQNRVSAEETKQAVASELYARGMALHYPVAFIYKDGLLSNRSYIGHKKADVYSRWIQSELAALNAGLEALRGEEKP